MPDNFSRGDDIVDLMDNHQLHQRRRRNLSIGHGYTGSPTASRVKDDVLPSTAATPRGRGLLENPFRNNETNYGRALRAFVGRVTNPTKPSHRSSTTRSLSPRRRRTQFMNGNLESSKVYIYTAVGCFLLLLWFFSKSRLEHYGHGDRLRPIRGPWRPSVHNTHADPAAIHNTTHVSIAMIEPVKVTIDWHRRQYYELQRLSEERAYTRRHRTRPPSIDLGSIGVITPPQVSFLPTSTSILENDSFEKKDFAASLELCGDHAKNASRIHPSHYSKAHVLGRNSIVLITGIFSPLGYHLAIQLAKKCTVQVMLALDPMYPTNYLHLLRSQQTIAYFFKRIPTIQQPIPVTFVGLDRRLTPQETEPKVFLNTTGEVNALANAKITHVIHLSSSDPYLYRDFTDDKYKERYESRHSYVADDRLLGHLFGFRQSVVSMEQLLMGLSTHVNQRIKFTYVSTWAPWKQHDDPRIAEDQGFFASSKLMDELMATTYSKLKQISSVAVRLPTVYGPLGRQGSLMYELAEKASYHWNDPKYFNHTNKLNTTTSKSYLLEMIGYKTSPDIDVRDLLFIDGRFHFFSLKGTCL